jgi:hypothetical protein
MKCLILTSGKTIMTDNFWTNRRYSADYCYDCGAHKDSHNPGECNWVDWPTKSYGAFARYEALADGHEDWMNVTVWPVDGLEPSDLSKDTTKGLEGSQNGAEA